MDVKKTWTLRCVLFLVGLFIISFGVNVNIMASFGMAGWDAYNIAMVSKFGFSIGFWINVNAVIYLILSAFFRKSRIKIEAFVTSLLIGVFIDAWGLLFRGHYIDNEFLKPICFFLGTMIICFGAGVYLTSKLPPNPIDELMLAIHHRFACSISVSKFIVEGTGVVIGFLLQGPIGLGTIFSLILLGPGIQFFYPRIEAWYEHKIAKTIS